MQTTLNRQISLTVREYYSFPAWSIFIYLCIGFIGINYLLQEFIITDAVYARSFTEQLRSDRIDSLLQFRGRWQWFGYVTLPPLLLFKTMGITLCLLTGLYLLEAEISFGKLWAIVVKAYLIFLLHALIITLAGTMIEVQTLTDVGQLDFFSLAGWIDTTRWAPWATFAASLVNLFDILFILILYQGLRPLLQRSKNQVGIGTIALSYYSGLLLYGMTGVFVLLSLGQ